MSETDEGLGANDYDKGARAVIAQLDPQGFFRWLLSEPFFAAWEWLGWLNTETIPFPEEPGRRCDIAVAFRHRAGTSGPVAVVLELMTRTRFRILERLAEYLLRVHKEQLYQERDPRVPYQVIGWVVNLTGQELPSSWRLAPPDAGGLGLWLEAGVRNLASGDAVATLAAIEAGTVARCLLPWLPLMRGGDDAALIPRWRAAAEQETVPGKLGLYRDVAVLFADLVGRKPLWQKGLEGWKVPRSSVALEWEREGELRGELRGKLEGKLEGVRLSIQAVLESRFQASLSADLLRTLGSTDDLGILNSWVRLAGTVSSLDAFLQVAQAPRP